MTTGFRQQKQQIMRRVFDGALPTAEERDKYHISTTDVRALEQFVPIYKEYFRSEIDDLECDFKRLMNDLDGEVDDLEYKYKKLEEENEKLKEEIERLETEVHHLS